MEEISVGFTQRKHRLSQKLLQKVCRYRLAEPDKFVPDFYLCENLFCAGFYFNRNKFRGDSVFLCLPPGSFFIGPVNQGKITQIVFLAVGLSAEAALFPLLNDLLLFFRAIAPP